MQPIDFRNATFNDVQSRLAGQRRCVFVKLAAHGPCTTRELAHLAAMDLLSVRPRVTELVDLGLVVLDEALTAKHTGQGAKHEGVYRALSTADAEALFAKRRTAAVKEEQLALI